MLQAVSGTYFSVLTEICFKKGIFLRIPISLQITSVQFSRSVVSDSLQPHELQHARPLSITNSRSSLRLTSIESVMLSSHLILHRPLLLLSPIPPSIRVFSNESASGGQSIGVSASVLPVNIQGWFSLELTELISLQSKGLSSVFSSTTVQKYQFFGTQLYSPTLTSIWLISIHVTSGKTTALTRWTFVDKVMSLLFNMLSRLVIAFLPRRKHLLTS